MSNFSNELLNHIKQIEKKLESLEKENAFLRKSLKQCSEVFLDIGRYGLTNWDSKDCRKLGNELKEIKLGE